MDTKLPSEKAFQKEAERKRLEAEKEERESRTRQALTATFSTPDGKQALRWLKAQCGHNVPILGANPGSGEIDAQRTVYSAMRLNLYLELRRYLPINLLKEVEYD